jgi:hypothetical protein
VIFIFIYKGDAQRLIDPQELRTGMLSSVNEYSVQLRDSLIQSIINQTNLDTLTHTVNLLSGEDPVTINDSTYEFISRNAQHPHNDLAADFIFQTLDRFGLPTYNQNYSTTGRNVYSIQTGTDYPDQKFIICAHYDDMPSQPPAPGADDNASGTAAVLEAARILSTLLTPYTIIYALWDEEEIGPIGSNHFAEQASISGEDILGVLNLDMIGWDGNDDDLMEIHTQSTANSVELANLVEFLNGDYSIGLSPVVFNPGTRSSDHRAFWNRGYTAILLIEAYWSDYGIDFNPFYHTREDRIVHFDQDYFYAMSKLAVGTIAHLAFYSITPVSLEYGEDNYLAGFELEQNYPNPFNSVTTIEFSLSQAGTVKLTIFNALGHLVETLVSEQLPAGSFQVTWDAGRYSSGIYFYRLQSGNYFETRKMIFMK